MEITVPKEDRSIYQVMLQAIVEDNEDTTEVIEEEYYGLAKTPAAAAKVAVKKFNTEYGTDYGQEIVVMIARTASSESIF